MPVPSQLVHKARGRKPAFQVSSKECSSCSSPLPLTLRLLGRALLLLGVGFRPLIWLLGGLLGLLLRAVFGGLLGLLFRPVLWLLGLLLLRPLLWLLGGLLGCLKGAEGGGAAEGGGSRGRRECRRREAREMR